MSNASHTVSDRSEGGPLACALHPEYCVLSNEDRSKSFVAVPLGAGDATRQLSELVECVDAALADFQQPPYYKVSL